jgi:hypothetical protein
VGDLQERVVEDGGWLANRVFWAIGILAVVVLGGIVKFSRWTGKVDSDREAFKGFMEEVREDLRKIRERIDLIFDRLPVPTEKTSSPLTLTDFGQSIAQDVGAQEVAKRLAQGIREKTRGMDPYEVQEHCLDFMTAQYKPEHELDSLINKVAYDRGVKREQVLRVIAIELRDQLLTDSE